MAAIAQHENVSEQVHEEIFTRLSDLLGHDNPKIRNSAATALSRIGGERAAEAIVRLFEDPDASVRSKAVFVIGFLHHKPALEVVRRLTRDRSKKVREMARIVLPELNSEFP